MEHVGFPPNDPLYILVKQSYDSLHHLSVTMHYRSCSGGVGEEPRVNCARISVWVSLRDYRPNRLRIAAVSDCRTEKNFCHGSRLSDASRSGTLPT